MRALTNDGRPRLSRLAAHDVLATCLSIFLATLSAGCATASAPPVAPLPAAAAPHVEVSTESPADKYRVELERASHLGRVLYLHDKVSSIATDAYLDHVASGGGVPVGGYLSLWEADAHGKPAMAFTVLFFTRDAEPRIAYRVHVPIEAGGSPVVEDVSPPAPPSPEIATLIRARQTAIAMLRNPTQPINPVVLPAREIGEDGFLVYLLAGTKRPGVAVLGLHHRVLVSPDGETVLRFEALSKGPNEVLLASPGLPPGAKLVELVTSNIVTNYPLETHVFASLLYKLPLSLVTPVGIWRVDGQHITYEGPVAKRPGGLATPPLETPPAAAAPP
jgi:hypothetical protein